MTLQEDAEPGEIARESVGTNTTLLSPFDSCPLPHFDPWDPEVVRYTDPNKDPFRECNRDVKPWAQLVNASIVPISDDIKCEARCIYRSTDWYNKVDKWVDATAYDYFCDVVESRCTNNDDEKFQMLHTQIVETPTRKHIKKSFGKQYSVYVILLDSVAHTQSIRTLPRTLEYFEKSMGAITLPYLNKIGKNSFPNGVAMWFGLIAEAIDRKMFNLPSIEKSNADEWCVDYIEAANVSFLLHEFQEYGYKTMMAEDWAQGTLNWPDCWGFDKQPTDHYMRPYQVQYEDNPDELLSESYKQMDCWEMNQDMLQYLKQFVDSYKGVPKFGWLWLSLASHDFPSGITYQDRDFQQFLIDNRHELDDAFVIIMGDHGLRFGSITETRLGALEVNNPMFSMALPKELRNGAIANKLRENARQLQTHFDFRSTLIDIMKHQPSEGFAGTNHVKMPNEHGSSLFRDQIPTERNCKTLPIPFEYCICQFATAKLQPKSKKAINLGKLVIHNINKWNDDMNYTDICVPFTFKKIIQVEAVLPEETARLYHVWVKTTEPASATFRVTVFAANTHSIELTSPVDRVDSYGEEGHCATYWHQPLCYCRQQLTEAPEIDYDKDEEKSDGKVKVSTPLPVATTTSTLQKPK